MEYPAPENSLAPPDGWFLTVSVDGAQVQSIWLGPNLIIGRDPGCHVVLDDKFVSRRHAVIGQPEPDHYVIMDLESINGTYLNGRRIKGEEALKPGDHITIGPALLVVHAPGKALPRASVAVEDEPVLLDSPEVKRDPVIVGLAIGALVLLCLISLVVLAAIFFFFIRQAEPAGATGTSAGLLNLIVIAVIG